MLRRLLLILALVALLVVAGYMLLGSRTQLRLHTVRRGDILHSFVANGRVEADRTFEVVPKVTARILSIEVKEGERVAMGQLLVTLEDSMLRAQMTEAEEARESAKARRDEVLRGTRPEDLARARAEVTEAEEAHRAAQAELAEAERGPRPEERRKAEAELVVAEAELDYARKRRERVRVLRARGYATIDERDEAERLYTTTEANLEHARAQRDLVVQGRSEEERARVRAAVAVAQARLGQARAGLSRAESGATEEQRRSAEAELHRAEAVVERLKSELEQARLTSGVDGVVARRYKEPSELAFPGMPEPILVLAEAGRRIVRAEVLEGDVYKVRLGVKATVTSDSFPGTRWGGQVVEVAPTMGLKRLQSQNPKEKTDVKVLEVKIALDGTVNLPISLPVEAFVSVTARSGVVVIPASSLSPDGTVTMADGRARKVETGARDDSFIEVLSGIAEGERILEGR